MGPVNGLRAFFVKEEKVPAGRKTSAPKAQVVKARPTTVQIEIEQGADIAQAWDKYFAANQPEEKAVREAVRTLRNDQKFSEAVALIMAALRHSQAQSWMYEALAISMQAAEKPRQEIERAMMSAAEFATNPADLIFLGAYLDQAGFQRRALQVLKQASLLNPELSEPYLAGMRIAKRLNDSEGIQWTTVGILGKAWPATQAEIRNTAVRLAKATLDDLRAKNRTREADCFEAALDAAVARDVAVIVSWTGDVDIDLMVREPGGSVCSLRDWRSAGGGTIQGDRPLSDGGSIQGHTIKYSCPKALSGEYQLLLRRVWGELTTGKVTVEVIRHFATRKEVREAQKVALDDGEVLVKFDLADGRRKEPLREVNAAAAEVALAKHQKFLAEQIGPQIAALGDQRALHRMAASRRNAAQFAANSPGGSVNPTAMPYPFPFQGAVGYQPVIITLPEGANLGATAVVSADRRYVRITCVPMFSMISKVTTFSTDTGATTTRVDPNRGQGFAQQNQAAQQQQQAAVGVP
jgi:tetratricopeptide (TPR) repeat protein